MQGSSSDSFLLMRIDILEKRMEMLERMVAFNAQHRGDVPQIHNSFSPPAPQPSDNSIDRLVGTIEALILKIERSSDEQKNEKNDSMLQNIRRRGTVA